MIEYMNTLCLTETPNVLRHPNQYYTNVYPTALL